MLGLIRKGLVTRADLISRSIVVTEEGLRLLGRTKKPIARIVTVIQPTACGECGATLFTPTCPMCLAELRELKKAVGRS